MSHFFTNLFKALGVLALSALIFYLFAPKTGIKDQAVNMALEFLGKRLLAMAPQEHEREIAARFEAVRDRVERGEIDGEHLQDFTTLVLNAEEPLDFAEIDSSLASLNETEAAIQAEEKRIGQEERRLEEWAHRMQAFEQFEKEVQTWTPDSLRRRQAHARPRPPRFYRLSKQFVVQIDSAAWAQAMGYAMASHADSLRVAAVAGRFPPPSHFETLVRRLQGKLSGLHVELHSNDLERERHWADSMRVRTRGMAREPRGVIVTVPPLTPASKTPPPPRRN